MVGSANGRSISALTSDLPRNSSRTSTQAISVPMTASIAATMADENTVSSSAATARRPDTAVQNVSSPPSSERTSTAASGSRTIRESQATAAPPEAAAPHGTRRAAGFTPAAGTDSASLGSGDPQVLLDLRHRAVG